MPPETIEKIVCTYFNKLDTMTPGGWLDIFAEEAVIYDPVGTPPNKVHEDYEKFFEVLSNTFDKMEVTADKMFITGNSAAVKWTMRAVGKNSSKLATSEGISVFDLNEAGKIKKVCAYWNEKELMNQLKD